MNSPIEYKNSAHGHTMLHQQTWDVLKPTLPTVNPAIAQVVLRIKQLSEIHWHNLVLECMSTNTTKTM